MPAEQFGCGLTIRHTVRRQVGKRRPRAARLAHRRPNQRKNADEPASTRRRSPLVQGPCESLAAHGSISSLIIIVSVGIDDLKRRHIPRVFEICHVVCQFRHAQFLTPGMPGMHADVELRNYESVTRRTSIAANGNPPGYGVGRHANPGTDHRGDVHGEAVDQHQPRERRPLSHDGIGRIED